MMIIRVVFTSEVFVICDQNSDSGHLLGNSCPLGKQLVLIVFCLFVIFIYFPFWF